MTCILHQCDGSGLIKLSPYQYHECDCKKIERAQKLFIQSGNEKKRMKFPNEYAFDPVILTKNKQAYTFKTLLKELITNIPLYEQDNQLILASGKMGTGKTSFASTFQLLYHFYTGKEALYIDARDISRYIFDNEEKKRIQDKSKKVEFLFIDDLGAESQVKDNKLPYILDEIDWLIRSSKGIVLITSNLLQQDFDKNYKNLRLRDELNRSHTLEYIFAKENVRRKAK